MVLLYKDRTECQKTISIAALCHTAGLCHNYTLNLCSFFLSSSLLRYIVDSKNVQEIQIKNSYRAAMINTQDMAKTGVILMRKR